MTRVLVTGSRVWSDEESLRRAMADIEIEEGKPTTLIHGGAGGLDAMADKVGGEFGWYIESYPADWQEHGKFAGPIRNEDMVASGPDVCLAFPLVLDSWSGTMQCMFTADRAGVPVFVCRDGGITSWTEKDYTGEVPAYMRRPEEG